MTETSKHLPENIAPTTVMRSNPELPQRREFLKTMALLLAGGSAASSIGCSNNKQQKIVQKQKEKDPEPLVLEPGVIRVCETPTSSKELFVGIYPGQEVVVASYINMHQRGLLQKYLKNRQEDAPKKPKNEVAHPGDTAAGSGFVMQIAGKEYLCSNEHVLKLAKESIRKQGILDHDAEFAIVPLQACTKKSPCEIAEIGSLGNDALPNRQVRILGAGEYFFEVGGPVHAMSKIEKANGFPILPQVSEGMPRFLSDDFCISLKKADILKAIGAENDEYSAHHGLFNGMSGSAVTDVQTGKVIGIFHTGVENVLDDDVLLAFTGPDAIRRIAAQMAQKIPQ